MPKSRTQRFGTLCALAALALLGCASEPTRRTLLPTLGPADTDTAAGYEQPPVLRASEILPREYLEGPRHRVDEQVGTDGFIHLYSIASDFGAFAAYGDAMLRRRVDEIQALDRLQEMEKSREFAAAVAKGLQSPLVASWKLIRQPVDTITGVPSQAWEGIKRTRDLAKGERSEYEDRALREFIGFEARKRELAYRIGVDPYSSNRPLQKELNRFAWVSYVGELPFAWLPSSDPQRPGATRFESGGSERLTDLLLLESPEDLRRINRIELALMGCPGLVSEAFLTHRWYSPRHQTILVSSLSALDRASEREVFIEAALRANSEFEAVYFQRKAEMLRAYNDHAAEIERIVRVDRAVAARASDGTLVLPMEVDHVVWTRPTAEFVRAVARALPEGIEPQRVQFLLSGTLSSKARAEIAELGFRVQERWLERLEPQAVETSRDER